MRDRDPGEHQPIPVSVTTPSKDEVLAVYRRVWGREASSDFNPERYRILRCGNKELLLSLGFDQGSTLLANLPEADGVESIPGETTALYREVKRLIEEHVREVRIPYVYMLETESPVMQAWAKTKGNEVFRWDQVIGQSRFLKYF